MMFTGFSKAGLSFLTELGNRDKSWLDANRTTYQAEVAEPAKAFAEAMGESLAMAISPDIVAVPKTNGSISPINNDVRFSKDASPYKHHLLFRFWEGSDKKSSPTLFVRVSEESVGFASGAHIGSIDRWRQLIADGESGSALVTAIAVLGKRRELEVAGEGLKRVPKPYGENHPRADLLRHKSFQARWPEPTPAAIHTPAFVPWCTKRLEAAAPVHRWLVDHRP